jgi:MacB-like periplasmic core domain
MRWLHRLFHKSRAEHELDRELRFHLDRQIADNLAVGMSPAEAHRQAVLTLGGVERVKQEVRDAHWETAIENLLLDFRYALRALYKDPRFALTAILVLALGISSSTIIFSVMYNGLLRPFPYKNASLLTTFSLHDLQDANLQEPGRGDRGGFTSAEFLAFREQNHSFDDLFGFMTKEMSLGNGQKTTQIHAALVTPDTFESLGVSPLFGRSVVAEDAIAGQPPVFAMNYRLWKDRFNADPTMVGKVFSVGGVARTLIAIMPPRFQINPEGSDIWVPASPNPSDSTISVNAAEPMHLWWPVPFQPDLGRLAR